MGAAEQRSRRRPPWHCWRAGPELLPIFNTLKMPIRVFCKNCFTRHVYFLSVSARLTRTGRVTVALCLQMCGILAAGCGRNHRRCCYRADREPPRRISRHPGARTPPRLVLSLPTICGGLPPNASRRRATPGSMAGSARRQNCTAHYALVVE